MEFETLNFTMELLATVGKAFSLEHRMTVKSSLIGLCKENQFQTVHLWGIIYGTENDYFIAYGIGRDYLSDRTYFYSLNGGLEWTLLPQPTDQIIGYALASTGAFTGVPEAECETELMSEDQADEEIIDESEGEDTWVRLKEEERLAGTVAAINAEVAIVPRGSLLKGPNGLVYRNFAFEGLDKDDALQPISYLHLRRPEAQWDKNLISRPDYNISLDFLDSIANDIPTGCWTITTDITESVATARSLYWPGAYCSTIIKNSRKLHVCGWSLTSWWYMGFGRKNWDLPFMIPPPPDSLRAAVVEFDRYETINEPADLPQEKSVKFLFEGDDIDQTYSKVVGLVPSEEEDDEEDEGGYAGPPAPVPSQHTATDVVPPQV